MKAGMVDCKPSSTPMVTGFKLAVQDSEEFDRPTQYRSTIGGVQYLPMLRPDLAFSVNKLSQFLQAPTVNH